MRDQHIIGEKLEFCAEDDLSFGPGLLIENCHLVFKGEVSKLFMVGVEIRNSTFEVQQQLVDQTFSNVVLDGVSFRGVYIGCRFGLGSSRPTTEAKIRNCDFAGAVLNHCDFFNCQLQDIRTAPWPTFLIPNPSQHAGAVEQMKWEGDLGLIMEVYADTSNDCVAAVGHAEMLVQEYGGSVANLETNLGAIGVLPPAI